MQAWWLVLALFPLIIAASAARQADRRRVRLVERQLEALTRRLGIDPTELQAAGAEIEAEAAVARSHREAPKHRAGVIGAIVGAAAGAAGAWLLVDQHTAVGGTVVGGLVGFLLGSAAHDHRTRV